MHEFPIHASAFTSLTQSLTQSLSHSLTHHSLLLLTINSVNHPIKYPACSSDKCSARRARREQWRAGCSSLTPSLTPSTAE